MAVKRKKIKKAGLPLIPLVPVERTSFEKQLSVIMEETNHHFEKDEKDDEVSETEATESSRLEEESLATTLSCVSSKAGGKRRRKKYSKMQSSTLMEKIWSTHQEKPLAEKPSRKSKLLRKKLRP